MPQRLRFRISISLDGYVAGPRQSVENPLGEGGMRLHEWFFPLAVFRRMYGQEGGTRDESTQLIEEALANAGATIMGRNMFGGHPGPWDERKPWNGWWGRDPPFHHPVFVLTHHPRPPLCLEGGTTFFFVTGGIHAALEQAYHAASGKDVALGGGAATGRQFLAAGLVHQLDLSLVPVLLGAGERLWDGLGPPTIEGLRLVQAVTVPGKVVHLRLASG